MSIIVGKLPANSIIVTGTTEGVVPEHMLRKTIKDVLPRGFYLSDADVNVVDQHTIFGGANSHIIVYTWYRQDNFNQEDIFDVDPGIQTPILHIVETRTTEADEFEDGTTIFYPISKFIVTLYGVEQE